MNDSQRRIYIVFSRTPGKLGRAIRTVTGEEYNHVSLALDPRLRRCYSFARIHENTPLCGGFVKESPLRFTRNGVPSRIMICALDIPCGRYRLLEQKLRRMEDSGDYIYNTVSALTAVIHRRVDIPRAYTCVEFVADMLRLSGVTLPAGFITVGELAALLGQNAVYRGSSEPFCRGAVWGRDEFSVRSSAGGYLLRTAGNFATLAARRLSAR